MDIDTINHDDVMSVTPGQSARDTVAGVERLVLETIDAGTEARAAAALQVAAAHLSPGVWRPESEALLRDLLERDPSLASD